MIHILNKNYFRYYGRILEKDQTACLGYTNSQIDFFVKSDAHKTAEITALIETECVEEANYARLKIMIDDVFIENNPIVIDKPYNTYKLCQISDHEVHKISIIKISEVQMSNAVFHNIIVTNGSLVPLPLETDNRMKVEFIGDSITCGYGVYGEPDSEFHIREEDGLASYAAFTAKELNFNARYFSVSGYGVCMEYTGDREGRIPRVYPYTNWWMDKEAKYDFNEFIPELLVLNIGTNDSQHLQETGVADEFVEHYVAFLKFLKNVYPNAKIVCICGTLCTESYEYIEKACNIARNEGLQDIYSFELPFHNVEEDGMASGHPSIQTHKKDAKRLVEYLKKLLAQD